MAIPSEAASVCDELRPPPAELDPERFEGYAARYDDLFARADQREWFRLYLRGLLSGLERKNVESIAAASAPRAKAGANLAQSLQHFVTHSPWDHGRVLARHRELLAPTFRSGAATWVIHDGVLLKKGRNSVGTQRQFARSLGRKVNCQVAVVVGVAGPVGYVPLAARLYLPGYWLREHPELAEKVVPAERRAHTTIADLALALLDEVRAEGWSAAGAVLDDGYATADGFGEALAGRGIGVTGHNSLPELAAAAGRFAWLKERLGLDHYEGRTWVGWHHHAALVFAAAGFLLAE